MGSLYLAYEYHVAATQLVLAMLGIGATLTPRDVGDVFRFPRAFGLGLAIQLLAVPALAALLASVLPVSTGMAAGLVLLAAVPGGTFSNLMTYFGRANVALSVSLTAITTLGCLITTPLVLEALGGGRLPDGISMPVSRVVFEIGVCLLGPLALGMAIGSRLESRRKVFAHTCIRLSIAVIVVMAIGSAAAGRIDVFSKGGWDLLAIVLFPSAAQAIAVLAALGTGLARGDAVAVAIEATVRNTNLALLLKASLFPAVAGVPDPVADRVLFAVLLYGGFAILATLPMATLSRLSR